MQRFCNSWRLTNHLVMVLRLKNYLKLTECIVSLNPHQIAQVQHRRSSISTVNAPLFVCHRQCQRRPLSVALNSHAEWSSPQTPGDLNRSNYTILNTCKFHATRIEVFQRAPTPWTRSVSWTQCQQWFSQRLGLVSLRRTPWNHHRLGVPFNTTSTVGDENTPRCRCYTERLHCWALGTQRSWLSWYKPRKQSLLPVCDVWRVQIYPLSDHEQRNADVLGERTEGTKHSSAFPKLQKPGWHPEAHGKHRTWPGLQGVGTTHSREYEMEWQSPMPYEILESRHHQNDKMFDVAASQCRASYLRHSALL